MEWQIIILLANIYWVPTMCIVLCWVLACLTPEPECLTMAWFSLSRDVLYQYFAHSIVRQKLPFSHQNPFSFFSWEHGCLVGDCFPTRSVARYGHVTKYSPIECEKFPCHFLKQNPFLGLPFSPSSVPTTLLGHADQDNTLEMEEQNGRDLDFWMCKRRAPCQTWSC